MKKKKPKGLIDRKSIRGNTIAKDIVQINLKSIKEPKDLSEILGKKADSLSSKETPGKEQKKE